MCPIAGPVKIYEAYPKMGSVLRADIADCKDFLDSGTGAVYRLTPPFGGDSAKVDAFVP